MKNRRANGAILPPLLALQARGSFEVEPRPGTITNVTVDKKSLKGTSALRSYAIPTGSGCDDDDIVAYYGVAKVS